MSTYSTASKSPSATSSNMGTKSTTSSTVPIMKLQNVKRKQARYNFRDFQNFMKNLAEYAPEYGDYDKAIQERDEARQELEVKKKELTKKEREIHYLNRAKNDDRNDFITRNKELETEKANAERKAEEERVQMLKSHESSSAKSRAELNKYKSLANRAGEEAQFIKKKMDVVYQELIQWEKHVSVLRPLKGKHDAWDNGVRRLNLPFGFSPDNTESAKKARVAVAMHVFSSELVGSIFKSCYVPKSEEQNRFLQGIVDKHLSSNPRSGKLLHALLLSTYSSAELSNTLRLRTLTAKNNVVEKLGFICEDGGVKFGSVIESLCTEAAKLWEDIQYSGHEIEIVDIYEEDWQWDELIEFGEFPKHAPPQAPVMLFPGFSAPTGARTELYKGYVLWADQQHIVNADSEWINFKKMMKHGRIRRPQNPRPRRCSIKTESPGYSPSSPVASPKEYRAQQAYMDSKGPVVHDMVSKIQGSSQEGTSASVLMV
ncbi:uncharacterized protein Z518_00394 [Rhinocladiella mackenziei CBS 650.93]|uniref:Uncharacterized protein n=1 Tax=Rhinocladiella mackenziei CBS 650.93 TaxID=1442369 RepID=A0A0D2JIQ5_9EURO|nr:uncharacterized protein Z518_00394 [Rhinocladiella mackenziei CBS 650.93]KIX09315.1 hypothetical protein Z518_00394 [Rhinocladiella mackenziei CBS 650.93]